MSFARFLSAEDLQIGLFRCPGRREPDPLPGVLLLGVSGVLWRESPGNQRVLGGRRISAVDRFLRLTYAKCTSFSVRGFVDECAAGQLRGRTSRRRPAPATRPATTGPELARDLAVQPRDLEILRALWRYRYLLTSQIAREWWPGRSLYSAQKPLLRLTATG
jgi:hypothetical protein